MKSRITIEVDFDNQNAPVIQILSRDSTDVRDSLIKAFYQSLGGSSWCKIEFRQHIPDEQLVDNSGFVEGFKRIFISPIPDADLKKEADIMLEQHRVNEVFRDQTVTK